MSRFKNNDFSIETTRGILEDMVKVGQYSFLWGLVDDITCNGHTISFKESNQFYHITIDDVYYTLSPYCEVYWWENGEQVHGSGIDHVISVLKQERKED